MPNCLSSILAAALLLAASVPADSRSVDLRHRGKSKVTLSAYVPAGGAGISVVICPGGSYFWLADRNEGTDVAEWLCSEGIAAFVLSYRVAGEFNFIMDTRDICGGNSYPAMLEDAAEAMRHIRRNALEYGICPDSVGIMGFSAGGHLAMLTAECRDSSLCCFAKDSLSYRPDFAALVYPVVTMSDESCVHRRSRRGLMGPRRDDAALRLRLSTERNVPSDCCPVFLVNCMDDRVVNCRNSTLLDSALAANGVRYRHLAFPVGGHGFGVEPIVAGDCVYDWKPVFLEWLSSLQL